MSDQYYYRSGGKRAGPVPFENLRELATKGELKRQTMVWCRGMKEWQPADSVAKLFEDLPPDLEAESALDVPPPLPVDNTSEFSQPKSLWTTNSPSAAEPARQFMRSNRQVFIAGYPIAVVFAVLAAHFAGDPATAESSSIFSVTLSVLLAAGALILSVVNWMIIHHRLWKLIPPVFASTSPDKAVGFWFLPLFNIYWAFVTFNGLARSANKTLDALNEPKVRCNESLALAFSTVQALLLAGGTAVPIFGILVPIAAYVLWILWYADLAKAFVIIERHAPKAEQAVVPGPVSV